MNWWGCGVKLFLRSVCFHGSPRKLDETLAYQASKAIPALFGLHHVHQPPNGRKFASWNSRSLTCLHGKQWYEHYLVGNSTCSQSRRENPRTLSSLSVAWKPRNERVHVWIVYLWLAFQPILQVPMLEKSNTQFRDHLLSSSLISFSFFWKWRFAFLGMRDTIFLTEVAQQAKGKKWRYGSNMI